MKGHYSPEFIEAVQDFFLAHLLEPYQAAAHAACEANSVDRFFTNYSLGANFWDASYGRMQELNKKNPDLRNQILCVQNALIFKIAGQDLRCYRIDPKTDMPRGGKAFKRILTQAQYYLSADVEYLVPEGKLMIGLEIDKNDGLLAGRLFEVRPRIDQEGYTPQLLKILYTQQIDLPDVQEAMQQTTSRRPRVTHTIDLGLDAINE